MDIKIRKATEEDLPNIFSLIKEFAEFLGKSDKVGISLEDLKREKENYECILALNDKDKVIGYAFYFYTFHTWTGKALYLDDLFVKEGFRRHSVGSMLLYALLDIAKHNNCRNLRWQVLEWNKSAIEFYKKFGAVIGDDNLNCNFTVK